jgi:tRNA pseudouridine55 synthase
MQSGFYLINKPAGPTSHDIVDQLRRITGVRKIGHAGTLDPFASGLLIVAIGREATRNSSNFVKMDKTYIAKLRLGATSDTYDRTGTIKIMNEKLRITNEEIEKTLKKFTGRQMQTPPMYSAKKVDGKKLYELARQGVEIERQPVEINVYDIEILDSITPPSPSYLKRGNDATYLTIEVRVSSGTYIRSLAHDIGQALGCGAYLEELTRTSIGKYDLRNSATPDELAKNPAKFEEIRIERLFN